MNLYARQFVFVAILVGFVGLAYHFTRPAQLPDFRAYEAGPERKTAFFEFLRPLLEAENERILEQRRTLARIAAKPRADWLDRWWLRRTARVFGVDVTGEMSDEELLRILLRRVDAVPLSLGLAQGAKESGWGTSRFTREGNNLFGEWCFRPGCGLIPRNRDEGMSHLVRSFQTAEASVRSYMDNLNTHPRYREFREHRARLRATGRPLSGLELAAHLDAYSQRRQAYINEITGIIRFNLLEDSGELTASTAVPSAASREHADDNMLNEQGNVAVVLLYHHVDEGTPESTSVTPATFERHLDYLAGQDYRIVSLERIVRSVRDGEPLPPRAVALTFDDAYASVYTEALPRLEQRGWPFTVFATTDYLDAGAPVYMDWRQLADLTRRGGSVGNHSRDHEHLVRRRPGETERSWRKRVRANIVGAQEELEHRIEEPLDIFAYPYGEFDQQLQRVVEDLGLAAVGQQSGPVGPGADLQALARFPVAASFADLESLGEKLRSRPLPVTVLEPERRVLPAGAEAPLLRLEIGEGPYDRDRLQCFVSGQDPAGLKWDGAVLEIRAGRPLGPGRSKYTCTAPSNEQEGVYYWYSHLWIQPHADGSWYEG